MTLLNPLIRVVGAVAIGLTATVQPASVFAHEGHHMECNDANINAMKADIQAMPDGKSKMTANKEMQAAQEMMQKKDMNGCMAHMHSAMDTIEK